MAEGEDAYSTILKVLKFSPRGLSITDISKKIKRERNSTSKCLDVLRAEGKVEVRQIGTARVYSLAQRVPLSAFLCFTRNMILIIDNDLNVVQANDQYVNMTDFSKQELIGKNLAEERLPVVSDQVARGIIESATKEQVITDIRALVGKEELFFKMEVIPTTFEGGDTGLTIVLEDITEKKRHLKNMEFLARTAMELVDMPPETDVYLYISERLAELVPEHSPYYVHSYDDVKGEFFFRAVEPIAVRQGTKELAGFDLVGMKFPVKDFFYAAPFSETAATFKDMREMRFRPFFDKEEISFYDSSARIYPKDVADAIQLRFNVAKIYLTGLVWQGQLFGLVGISQGRDETLQNKQAIESFLRQASIAISRRQTEERLMRSEMRFRDLIAANDHPMAVINQDRQVTMINPAFTEMFGYTQADIPTLDSWHEKGFPDPEIRREAASLLAPDPGNEQTIPPQMFPVWCKYGEEKSVLFRPILLSDGTRVMSCDVSAEKR